MLKLRISDGLHMVARKVILCGLISLPLPLFATLGEDVSSVQSDQAHINAQLRILPSQSYSIHELRSPTGTTVREFVSPAGAVFGVTWRGPFSPDLRQLLGTHFEEYVQAVSSASNHSRGGIHVDTGDLVFESGGHMRFITGRAYLRSKMPSGVASDDLR